MPQPLYFRRDRNGRPLPGSNVRATRRPSTAHIPIENVFNGPIPDFQKQSYPGVTRYFVEFNETTRQIVPGSLIARTTIPDGYYLELFRNNIIALPKGDTQDSGVILEENIEQLLEDELITERPVFLISQNYIQNGYRG